ncbi:LLM class flavin-dependent oxidoreductase [Tengunoibacter tsumagoiensis]|uniref:Luciferase-like domain-containing protein n=1 Tax=Tengunoibacter tsumagoiensis TaxID=2014871 RepID=A0A401ZVR7_9CHLR|nr:LLM class flavin-dependent oxidoreductase [Tengunoibacter tsumagoiensis]GCE10850.1 hypothetical protein KTT_07090 [Tengunoibacter tsumagoiensis]
MAQIELGWIVPVGSNELTRKDFLSTIKQGLHTIAGHFDSVWLPDHLQFGDRPFLEGWTALTYLAAMEPELKYGHIVLCQLFRNPAVLAKMAATFQYMSQGNFILGIGAGWHEEECKAYHLPFPGPGQRVAELEEALQIIQALWKEDNVSFEGKYHQITNAFCIPRPEPIPPIMIAAFQPRMLRLTAKYADWWNIGAGEIEKTREMVAGLNAACEQIGRDPKSIRRTAMVGCYCARDEQKLKALLAKHQAPFPPGFTGTPEQIVEQLQPLIELGFDYFMVNAGGFPDLTTLELLSSDVLPLLQK